MDYRIGVRLEKREYDHLVAIADKMGCTLSQAIRLIISESVVVTKTVQVPVATSKISIPVLVKMIDTPVKGA